MAVEQCREHAHQCVMDRPLQRVLFVPRLLLEGRNLTDFPGVIGRRGYACRPPTGEPLQKAWFRSRNPRRRRHLGGRRQRLLCYLCRPAAQLVELHHDRSHVWLHVLLQQAPDHLPEVDAQVLDAWAVGDLEISRDPDQQLMQRQSFGPERNQLADGDTGQVVQLIGGLEGGEHILGPEDRAQMSQLRRHRRLHAGIPGIT